MSRPKGAVEMDDQQATAAPVKTEVTPYNLEWRATQIKAQERELRMVELLLADDDAERTERIRKMIDAARSGLESAERLTREAAKALADAKGQGE